MSNGTHEGTPSVPRISEEEQQAVDELNKAKPQEPESEEKGPSTVDNGGNEGGGGGTGPEDDSKLKVKENNQWDWDSSEMIALLAEAKALNEYLARHGGSPVYEEDQKGSDEEKPGNASGGKKTCPQLYPGHSELIDTIAAATKQASAENWKKLFKSYSRITGALYQERGVSGKSILDTLDGGQGKLFKKKNIPILLGIGILRHSRDLRVSESMGRWHLGPGEGVNGIYRPNL